MICEGSNYTNNTAEHLTQLFAKVGDKTFYFYNQNTINTN